MGTGTFSDGCWNWRHGAIIYKDGYMAEIASDHIDN